MIRSQIKGGYQPQVILPKMRTEEPSDSATAKRRELEKERKIRVFDPKSRTIGIDKIALDAQVEETARMRLVDKQRDEFYGNQALDMDRHALYLQAQQEHEKVVAAQDMDQYRLQYQKREATREWDLNDPCRIRNDLPGRIGDEDPRCGASSMQCFHGEDLDGTDRKKRQQGQMLQWIQQQLDEKNLRRWLDREGNLAHRDRDAELQRRTEAIANEVEMQKKAITQATAEFNRRMAEQKKEEKARDRRQETLDNAEEIRNWLDSDLLTENPFSTLNANDPRRFKRYHMKGLAPEAKQAILNEQAAQRDELRRRREQEAEEERQWALQQKKLWEAGANDGATKEAMRKAALLKLQEEHRRQAAYTHEKARQLNETYKNDVTDEWWNKWNTTSR